jgi:hypothetical protein
LASDKLTLRSGPTIKPLGTQTTPMNSVSMVPGSVVLQTEVPDEP